MEAVAELTGAEPARLAKTDFDFELPHDLIAQHPAEERSAARLLVWDRATGQQVHARVGEFPGFLRRGDVMVFNDTIVVPARLHGRVKSGGTVELLVVRPSRDGGGESPEARCWECLGRPARRLRIGAEIVLAGGVAATIVAARPDGRYGVSFGAVDVPALLASAGEVPLPPYIHRPDGPLALDRERYQTVFASRPGAVAAPTAGLHFSHELLGCLRDAGVDLAFLTLHVGPGTFLPVRQQDLDRHVMEAEWCEVPSETVTAVQRAKEQGRRVIAVGTTSTRALESAYDERAGLTAGSRWADLFIRPGHHFRVIDALLTNFHLPGSTLLALVAAFAGRHEVLSVYREAVRLRYRFYSYGDAMLIL
jgi:S-adenosylmethionine:tRNA ribosyltransferase-isomerase